MSYSVARPRAAVIGAGVSGLTAAYVLSRRYDATLYEAARRLGGHADTREIAAGDGRTLALDTGFIVHNSRGYPQLVRLFAELGVATAPTQMSMSVRCAGCGLEYAGSLGPRGLFPAARSLARPEYLRLLAAVPGFYRRARALLGSAAPDSVTLGEFLRRGGYRPYFTGHFVMPLVAAVWSCAPADALRYPARYLFQFLDNHGVLTVRRSAAWRVVRGGSRTYVDAIAKQLSRVVPGVPVRSVRREAAGVAVTDAAGRTARFGRAVIATHPDQALALLDQPTLAQTEVPGAFRYTDSAAALHTDVSVLPVRRAARASWNYLLSDCRGTADQVHVSYWLNRLHGLTEPADYLVTLNALDQVRPERVIDRLGYRHPLYTPESVAAQRRLPELNTPRLAFAGAHHGWGFHEDGCRSGVQAARALGVRW